MAILKKEKGERIMKATVAVLLALILLAGCSLPINFVANLQNLAAPPAELPTEELLTGEDARQIAIHHAKAEEEDDEER